MDVVIEDDGSWVEEERQSGDGEVGSCCLQKLGGCL